MLCHYFYHGIIHLPGIKELCENMKPLIEEDLSRLSSQPMDEDSPESAHEGIGEKRFLTAGGKRGFRVPVYPEGQVNIPFSLRGGGGARSYLSSGWNRVPLRKRPSKMMAWGIHRLPVSQTQKRSNLEKEIEEYTEQ